MNEHIFDSEMKILELIWAHEPICAKELSLIAAQTIGWNKNTTYTVLKKIEAKGYIRREEPGFVCTALISREDIQRSETRSLIDKLFGGSRKALFSALLEDEHLSQEELAAMRRMIEEREP